MITAQAIREQLQPVLTAPDIRAKPQEYLDRALNVFNAADDVPIDVQDEANSLARIYCDVANKFWYVGMANEAAIFILLHGLDKFSTRQKSCSKYISKIVLLNELTAVHLHVLRDMGAATFWALHTYAEEIIGNNPIKAAMDNLHSRLGVANNILTALKAIAEEKRQEIDGNWSKKEAYPEETVRELFASNPQFSHVFSRATARSEFPLSKAYFEILLDEYTKAQSENEDNKQKQITFERLASYLFLLVPGFVPQISVKDTNNSYETDIVVRNLNPTDSLLADTFGRYFAAECKNTKEPVNVRDVGYFLFKMKLMHTKFGVYFAKKGITGQIQDETAARQLIRRAFHEDKTLCVILSDNELDRLCREETTFRSLLFELSEKFRFGK